MVGNTMLPKKPPGEQRLSGDGELPGTAPGCSQGAMTALEAAWQSAAAGGKQTAALSGD